MTRHPDRDDLVDTLYQVAEDALYVHPRVRWVLLDGEAPIVVTRDGRSFELSLREIEYREE